jgi:small subunit ribosomal protein S16
MVKIRLSRGGSKKRPVYHIVATDRSSSRDGKYLERLGFYNPSANKNEEDIRIDLERFSYWKSVGAQVSDRVKKLAKLTDLSREERDIQNVSKLRKRKAKQEERRIKETPAEEAPVEETPVEETPAEEAPVEETPAEEAAEETPAEEAPVEETPAEETPAEDAAEETSEKKDKDDSA